MHKFKILVILFSQTIMRFCSFNTDLIYSSLDCQPLIQFDKFHENFIEEKLDPISHLFHRNRYYILNNRPKRYIFLCECFLFRNNLKKLEKTCKILIFAMLNEVHYNRVSGSDFGIVCCIGEWWQNLHLVRPPHPLPDNGHLF
jgi:hypothetical protein